MADPTDPVPSDWTTCPRCGAVGPPEHIFCYRCGARIPPPNAPVHPCPSCGTLVDDRTQTFCGKCGRPLGGAGPTLPTPSISGEPEVRRRRRPPREDSSPGTGGGRWLVALLVVVLVVVSGLWAI